MVHASKKSINKLLFYSLFTANKKELFKYDYSGVLAAIDHGCFQLQTYRLHFRMKPDPRALPWAEQYRSYRAFNELSRGRAREVSRTFLKKLGKTSLSNGTLQRVGELYPLLIKNENIRRKGIMFHGINRRRGHFSTNYELASDYIVTYYRFQLCWLLVFGMSFSACVSLLCECLRYCDGVIPSISLNFWVK